MSVSDCFPTFFFLPTLSTGGFLLLRQFRGISVPHLTCYGVYISQLIRFAQVSSHVDDFNMSIFTVIRVIYYYIEIGKNRR